MSFTFQSGTVTTGPYTDSGGGLITVETGASIASFSSFACLDLSDGPWTINVNGSILAVGVGGNGIFNPSIGVPASTITVGVDGSIVGEGAGLVFESAVNITNSGTIRGSDGVNEQFNGNYTINNTKTGVITSTPEVSVGAAIIMLGTGIHTITNAGRLVAGLEFPSDESAAIDTRIAVGIEKVTNTGHIVGRVTLGAGDDSLTNSGLIERLAAISATVQMGSGADKISNTGTIKGDVDTGEDNDTITASGKGAFTGIVILGDGDDKFTSTASASIDTVKDGNGSDTISMGGGNDAYIATGASGTDLTDTINAGGGLGDTYDASASTARVFINLDTVSHNELTNFLDAKTARGTAVSGVPNDNKDIITGFENAKGGTTHDVIYGNSAANILEGGGGNDTMAGYAGNDQLFGGAGADDFIGGAGRDTLDAGAADGATDTFYYQKTSDSGASSATRDLIVNFDADGPASDKIDLSAIDANIKNGGSINDTFDFLGTNAGFTGAAGELRAVWEAADGALRTVIYGDVNGDMKADFSIALNGTHTLDDGDFVL